MINNFSTFPLINYNYSQEKINVPSNSPMVFEPLYFAIELNLSFYSNIFIRNCLFMLCSFTLSVVVCFLTIASH